MRLTVLGSGSPEPYARRASSGYLLEAGGDRILLDCGGGVFDNLLRSGRPPDSVTHLFFTHLHSDHMMDYARLAHAAWDLGAPPLRVWGPPPVLRISQGYFGKDGVLSHDLNARTGLRQSQEVWKARGGSLPRPWIEPRVTEIGPGFVHSESGWTLRSCEVPHAQPLLDCMAYAIECGGRKIVYSGDAGLCPQLAAMAQGADLLIHWCYRLSIDNTPDSIARLSPPPREIAAMAESAGVKKLILSHFRTAMDRPGGHESAMEDLAAQFSGTAAIAEDLDVYEI